MTLAKHRRVQLGLTAREVATLAGLSQPEVTLIENARLRPSVRQLELMARALRVSTPAALVEEVRLIDSQQAVLLNEAVPA